MLFVECVSDGGVLLVFVVVCEMFGVLIYGEMEWCVMECVDEDDVSEVWEMVKEGVSDVEDGEVEKFVRVLSVKLWGEVLEALTGYAETLFGDGGDKEVSGVVVVMVNLVGDDGGVMKCVMECVMVSVSEWVSLRVWCAIALYNDVDAKDGEIKFELFEKIVVYCVVVK